jgi:hypothetical protein
MKRHQRVSLIAGCEQNPTISRKFILYGFPEQLMGDDDAAGVINRFNGDAPDVRWALNGHIGETIGATANEPGKDRQSYSDFQCA